MPKEQKDKKKKKYKLQVMDVITIVFTAAILGIMGYVLYDHIAENSSDPGNSSKATVSNSTPAPTKEPTLTDVGNIYGNITNDANVVINDGREYFISVDDNGDKHIYVTVDNVTTDLIKTEASCLNVITDYVTHADVATTEPYFVFYINGDGKICYFYDYPGSDGAVSESLRTENIFLDGSYKVIDVSGEYVYHLNSDGVVAKTSIISKTTETLSSERKYKSFVLYFGTIYAEAEDGNIYRMNSVIESADASSTASAVPTATATATATTTATATASPAPKEILTVSGPFDSYALDEDWIYVINGESILRYSAESTDAKDTLCNIKAESINAYSNAVFYYADGHLYTATAEGLLMGEFTDLGEISSTKSINVSSNAVYVVNEKGKLCKSTYDKDAKAYSAFKEMN